MSQTVPHSQPNRIPTAVDLGFDPGVLREKYAAERAKRLRARQARSVEPTTEAEAEWVKLVTRSAVTTEYQDTCTPGYYNGEGTNKE